MEFFVSAVAIDVLGGVETLSVTAVSGLDVDLDPRLGFVSSPCSTTSVVPPHAANNPSHRVKTNPVATLISTWLLFENVLTGTTVYVLIR